MSKTEKRWIEYPYDHCPNCGDGLQAFTDSNEIDTDGSPLFYDGDDIRCVKQCGYESCISVGEDGDCWVQDGNEAELTNNDFADDDLPDDDFLEDEYDGDDVTTFWPCDNCDLPDACEDFGCAIKKGLREDPSW